MATIHLYHLPTELRLTILDYALTDLPQTTGHLWETPFNPTTSTPTTFKTYLALLQTSRQVFIDTADVFTKRYSRSIHLEIEEISQLRDLQSLVRQTHYLREMRFVMRIRDAYFGSTPDESLPLFPVVAKALAMMALVRAQPGYVEPRISFPVFHCVPRLKLCVRELSEDFVWVREVWGEREGKGEGEGEGGSIRSDDGLCRPGSWRYTAVAPKLLNGLQTVVRALYRDGPRPGQLETILSGRLLDVTLDKHEA